MPRTLLRVAALALCCAAGAQDEPVPVPVPQNDGADTNNDNEQVVRELLQSVAEAQQAVNEGATNEVDGKAGTPGSPRPLRGQGPRGTPGVGTNSLSLTAYVARQATNNPSMTNRILRLNFRNAPLSLVLDYLSDAAGFSISANSKVDLKGTISVWSNQLVSRNEAVQLLHTALSEHNYAATVEGNILSIYIVDPSTTEIVAGIPEDYNAIPATKDLVTQIIYIHNVEAAQLITTLQPLMPNGTSMTSNQGANAIVLTDTKANIRRMAQLVKALDTASVSGSEVRVFPLSYADATALAQVVTQLFQSTDSNNNQNNRGRFGGFPFGGGGGPPGFGGFGGGGGNNNGGNNSSSGAQAGRVAAAKVTAVADERSNALVVSASADNMTRIEQLVQQMDVNVDDLTELRVFRLRHADPQEISDQLTSLFPDPTSSTQSSRGQQFGFRGFFGGGGGNNNNNRSGTSADSRNAKQSRVTAVPDPRTSSVIVSASSQMMGQIANIVEELDSDPSRKKKVYVIPVENRDPADLVEDLQSVISTDTSGGNTSSSRSTTRANGGQLNTRSQNNQQNSGSTTSGFGNNSSRQSRN